MTSAPDRLTADDVRAAEIRLRGEIHDTPCLLSRTLSEIAGCTLFLKFENLQFTASFKERGALNKMAQLSAEERARGVLAVSAGNHAQAVAYHAERMGIAATIVMPRFAPSVKVERTRGFGAEVVLEGDTFEDARAHALRLAAERGLTVGNCDLTLVAEAPRIGPYRAAMRDAIAADLGISRDSVNLKATTAEGMGEIGRGEGLAAHAVVLLLDAHGG